MEVSEASFDHLIIDIKIFHEANHSLLTKLKLNRVNTIPGCHILVVDSWSHDCCHDGGDVEIWPSEHFLQNGISCEVLPIFSDSPFHWNSSLIIDWLMLVSVVVGLDKEPSLI